MEILNFVLAVVGAAAWIPSIIDFFRIKNRVIKANVVDYQLCTNAEMKHANNKDKIKGTILLLAVNLYVSEKSYYVSDYEINVRANDNTKSRVTSIDGGLKVNYGKERVNFKLPNEYNFNLHREIIADKDNIRIFKVILENLNVDNISQINDIEFIFKDGKQKRTITITNADMPNFDKMNFLSEFEEKLQCS